MATIRDISRLAEVSTATVSRVINGGNVNEETKKKVMKFIEELNYAPNTIAQGLNNKKTKTIALIIPDITNPFFPELARAVEDIAKENGYTVLLFNSDEKSEKTDEYLKIIQQKYIDGLILATMSLENYKNNYNNIPIVVLDRVLDKTIDSVVADNRKGGRMAAQHLLDIGCAKIAHVRGPQHTTTAQERYEGFLEIVVDREWFNENLVVDGHFNMDAAKNATKSLLLQNPDIDGIFAGNDLMAVGVTKAIQQMGKKIPDDIAVIGFDGIDLSKYTEPELSTIAQPIYEMGALSTRLLLNKLDNNPQDVAYYELDVSLIQRASTKRK